eukprot:TRINITY_DN44245_c0_g1_i1.p1 TRINITY_DN44245_c0_g1~~TRINITY_DN44245_c0_g1_i1.p1  ORF type:complete len:483 (-),score=68.27 TRINITY_DN44245_c0_g1_i1:30-1421(-)
MLFALGAAIVIAAGGEILLPDDARITYIGRFRATVESTSPIRPRSFVPHLSSSPEPFPKGYACTVEHRGEMACLRGACPLDGVTSVQACADACSGRTQCAAFVFKDSAKCHLKSEFTEEPREGLMSEALSCVATRTRSLQYFGWVGTQVACRFKGTSIAAQLMGSKGGDRFLTILDGHPHGDPFVVPRSADLSSFVLADGLVDGEHSVVLWKVTEDTTSECTEESAAFGGFTATQFLSAPAPRVRRFEFIGDADTTGWCVDGNKTSGDERTKTQNAWKTWAAQLARDLNADFVAEAVSGIGVKDWPIQTYLANTLPFCNESAWNSSRQQIPDAVVLLIGPNDNNPESKEFAEAYTQLMEDVVSLYKGAVTPPKIIHVCGGSMNGFDPCKTIKAANSRFNVNRSDAFKGYYTSMSKDSWDTINSDSKYQGCGSHYNEKGHEVLKNEIIDQVRNIVGWNDTSYVI